MRNCVDIAAETPQTNVRPFQSSDPPPADSPTPACLRSRMTATPTREIRMLLPCHDCVQQVEGDWMVVRAIPNHEKTIVRRLLGANQPFFFPHRRVERTYEKLTRTAFLPVASGYVFATTTARDFLNSPECELHLCGGDRRFIDVSPRQRREFVNGLANLQIISDANDDDERMNEAMHPIRKRGKPVQVIEGQYNGLSGEVVGWDGRLAIIEVSIVLLGQAFTVRIREEHLSEGFARA